MQIDGEDSFDYEEIKAAYTLAEYNEMILEEVKLVHQERESSVNLSVSKQSPESKSEA